MTSDTGFIKIYRKMAEWEWYDDIPTKVVFLHLLITANWKDKNWHGITVKRGEKIISWSHLAEETCLTVQQVRTAVAHLESTGELTRYQQGKCSVVAIKNYDSYQDDNRMLTGNQQDANKMVTTCQQDANKVLTTTKEKKEREEDKESKNINDKARQAECVEIVEYLNSAAGLNFKPSTAKTQACIRARLNEGFSVADFKTVIDKKVASWQGTDMQKFIRPETLFGAKFEGYLNEKIIKGTVGLPKNTSAIRERKDDWDMILRELEDNSDDIRQPV